tara:strand:+ start:10709 stop:12520 length:1812 start_codon:yes stop_codon:yes gene_type:complete
MMKFYVQILTIFFIFTLFVTSAMAQEQQNLFGLAMHGQTKYDANSANLDYVNPDAPKGGAVKMSAIGTFDTLNPYALKGQAPQNMNLVYDRLMRRVWDEPFTMYPLISEHVEVAEDRSWITFHINPKARFQDGAPITADDVLFSYETLKEHGRPNMRRIYKLVKTAEVTAPLTIHFTLGDGYDRETIMILAMMPVLSKQWWSGRNFDSTVTETPLLNGPYRIKAFEMGRNITYERDDNYWAKDLFVNKGQYNFGTVTYDYFRDDTIALEAFKKGDLDIRREWDVTKWQTAYTDMIPDMVQHSVHHQRPERAHGFYFNMRKPPFDDIRVRKALTLAFDADWVLKNLYHSEFKRIDSFFPNAPLAAPRQPTDAEKEQLLPWKDNLQPEVFNSIGYGVFSPTMPPAGSKATIMRFKLKQAAALLKDAGWIVVNGRRVQKDTHKPFDFEILISTPQDEKIALTYQRALERLGIHMTIRMADSATFQKRTQIYDYDVLAFFNAFTLSPGSEQTLYWTCRSADEVARFNYSGICNPALDYFASKIANAKTYDDLVLYAHIIDRIALSEYVFVPLYYKGVDYIAYNKNIVYPQNVPIYGVVLESWWMAPK